MNQDKRDTVKFILITLVKLRSTIPKSPSSRNTSKWARNEPHDKSEINGKKCIPRLYRMCLQTVIFLLRMARSALSRSFAFAVV